MKKLLLLSVLCALSLPLAGESMVSSRPAAARKVPTGPHESRVEVARDALDENGMSVQVPTSYISLATGLNRWDKKRKDWVAAVPEFELTKDGYYVARQTRTELILPPDLSTEPVDMLGPDGVRLISAPLGVAVVDLSTGDTALLGDLKSCRAEWVTPHTIVYRNCFSGLKADLVYEINLAGMEQYVVLREWIPSLEDLKMSPASVRVQVYTEFLDAPEPKGRTNMLKQADASTRNSRVWEPDLTDRDLTFGKSTWMIPGRAFAAGDQNVGAPVAKSYEAVGRRRLLVESCDYVDVAPWLEQLPVPETPGSFKGVRLDPGRLVPSNLPGREANKPRWASLPFEDRLRERGWAEAGPESREIMDTGAYLAASGPGLVLDYTISDTLYDYTFQADTTYDVTGLVVLHGTTIIEGGAVIKYPPGNGVVLVRGPFVCDTAPYRPAVFTARDDDSVGVILDGSTGKVGDDYYGLCQLYFLNPGGPVELQHVRFKHGGNGLAFNGNCAPSVRHAQLIDCRQPLYLVGGMTLKAQNVLIAEVKSGGAAFAFGGSPTIEAEHVTVVHSPRLHGFGTPVSFTLRNSLLVDVDSIQPYAGSHTEEVTSSTAVFHEEGAGHYYLAAGSRYRDAGTDQISPDLLAELKTLTTRPPVVHDHVTLSTPNDWTAQVERDSGPPDLGYHYPPLDYAVDALTIAPGGSLSVAPGIAIGVFGYLGMVADDFSQVSLVGTAWDRIKLVHYTTVQEQSEAWGSSQHAPGLIRGAHHGVIAGHQAPDVELRFVDTSVMGGWGGGPCFQNNWDAARRLVVRDCRFFGGYTVFASHHSQPGVVDVSNNLFRRTTDTFYGWMHLTAHNNLFWGGTSQFVCYIMESGVWTVKDNAFHDTSITGSSSYISRGNNAYLGTVSPVPPGWIKGSDTLLAGFNYLPGPLGEFYHADTRLEDQGSRTAAQAGLYHHATQPDLLKEADTPVDIGFHYVAVDPDGALRTLGGTATQSSTYLAAVADLAADGNRDGVYRNGSVSHTRGQAEPWWQLDLGAVEPIAGVRIWNRTDCCMTRLSDFYVFVSEVPFQYDTVDETLDQAGVEAFYFPGPADVTENLLTFKAGRHVRVQLTTPTVLHLAEVEPWANTTGDTDRDGIPDYLEDADGNGHDDTGEAGWQDSGNATTGVPSLVVFTPLE